MTDYLLYPGCSMDTSARAYNTSLYAIAKTLGMTLTEVDDWNCCGATEYLGISTTPAYALIARNLAIASGQTNGRRTMLAPCSACYLNLAKADHVMAEDERLNADVNEALAAGGLHYDPGSLDVRHLLEVIVNDIGLDYVKDKVTRPLSGLRVAPYVGCMVARPDYSNRWSDHEQPTELDRLLAALGAEVIDFPLKTHCCGGHMTQIGPDTAYELIRRLLHAADQFKADVIATLCPMCQLNLDAYQNATNKHFGTDYEIPVVFFTQLIGLAFGFDAGQLGFGREMVSADGALDQIGVEPPPPTEEEQRARKRTRRPKRDSKKLPMPQMPGREEGSHV
jgi:heterodisulfide reductase subunit B